MGDIQLPQPFIFEWDAGNEEKNVIKHQVSNEECEQVFTGGTGLLLQDIQHSSYERRYTIIGFTDAQRLLCMAFTIRGRRVRVISARVADKKERKLYEEAT